MGMQHQKHVTKMMMVYKWSRMGDGILMMEIRLFSARIASLLNQVFHLSSPGRRVVRREHPPTADTLIGRECLVELRRRHEGRRLCTTSRSLYKTQSSHFDYAELRVTTLYRNAGVRKKPKYLLTFVECAVCIVFPPSSFAAL